MGQDKALMRAGGKTLIQIVFDRAREVFDRVMVISDIHEVFEGIGAPVFKDIIPFRGAMVGIVSALLHADTPYVFVVGCDMPLVTAESIKCVVRAAGGEDIVVPRMKNGYFEPLHAAYNRSCISPFLSCIERGRRRKADVYPYLIVRGIEDGPHFMNNGRSVFTNVNTKDDLENIGWAFEETLNADKPGLSDHEAENQGNPKPGAVCVR